MTFELFMYSNAVTRSRHFCVCVDGSSKNGMVTCNMVSSTSSCGMEVGQQFDTAKEVMEYVADYAKKHFHPLRRSSCTTIAAYNRKVNAVKYYIVRHSETA